MTRPTLWGLLLLLTIAPAQAASLSPAQTVEAVSRARLRALVARDKGAFDKYYAPQFSLTLDTGQRVGVSYLKDFVSTYKGRFTFAPSSYRVVVSRDGTLASTDHDMDEKYYAPNGALADEQHTVFTEVWQKRGAQWQVVHEQIATRPPAKPKS